MKNKTYATTTALLLVALAGCAGETTQTTTFTDMVRPALAEGKGGILGLLIDDVYRPVPDGLVLLQGAGVTATTDASGQFSMVGLEPGTYILVASAEGHDAAPVNVDVMANQYSEVEVSARRIFSQDGVIITTQYSVFVPCAVSAPAASLNFDCTGDTSGDTFRSGFTGNYTGYKEATYLITEMRSNHEASPSQGAYKVVVRERGNGDYWASKFITEGNYMKLTMRVGNVSLDDTENRNVEWKNNKHMETLLFPQGAFKGETQQGLGIVCGASGQGCFESRGLGPQAGVKATFVQSLFLGEPEVDIERYCVLAPTAEC
jgi:hypothetical protein